MASLEALKITECPLAFATIAAKHNALVDMLAAMQGQNGITVVMAERNSIIRANVSIDEIHFNDGAIAIDIDAAGVMLTNISSGHYAKMYPTGAFGVVNGSTGKELLISPGDLTENMGVREIDVCDTGVAKKMLIVASDPY